MHCFRECRVIYKDRIAMKDIKVIVGKAYKFFSWFYVLSYYDIQILRYSFVNNICCLLVIGPVASENSYTVRNPIELGSSLDSSHSNNILVRFKLLFQGRI